MNPLIFLLKCCQRIAFENVTSQNDNTLMKNMLGKSLGKELLMVQPSKNEKKYGKSSMLPLLLLNTHQLM